ncbi:MAG TPA: POTRA domain-containing protein, partial [Candidatus Acidoferrum sp.]|nr:POTRA domain-containing protein [Candidatus Acidoferrum sp.]
MLGRLPLLAQDAASPRTTNPSFPNAPAAAPVPPKPEEKKKTEKPAAEPAAKPVQIKLETPPAATDTKNPRPQPASQAPEPPGQLKLETPQQEEPKPEAPGTAKPAQSTSAPQARKTIIEKIDFRGNRRIPAATLRARMFTHAGDAYDENSLERDFMALWNTGYL